METTLRSFQNTRLLFAAACAIALSACASIPEPVGDMASAKTVIKGAEMEKANRFAAVELDRAKTKMKRAEQAIDQKNYVEAKRLAQQALVDARLARAKSDAARSANALKELEDSMRLLREQLNEGQ